VVARLARAKGGAVALLARAKGSAVARFARREGGAVALLARVEGGAVAWLAWREDGALRRLARAEVVAAARPPLGYSGAASAGSASCDGHGGGSAPARVDPDPVAPRRQSGHRWLHGVNPHLAPLSRRLVGLSTADPARWSSRRARIGSRRR